MATISLDGDYGTLPQEDNPYQNFFAPEQSQRLTTPATATGGIVAPANQPGSYQLPTGYNPVNDIYNANNWQTAALQQGQQAKAMAAAQQGGYQVPAAASGDPMRALIQNSLKRAYGRDATDQDYAYWLPKLQADPNNMAYWEQRLLGQGASGQDAARYGQWAGGDPNAEQFGRAGTMGSGQVGANAFDDPATAQWNTALNQLAARLQQPQNVPDMGPLQDYLRSYFQQLQGPAYTANDMELIKTQTQDPLTSQRDAQRQQVVERFAAQGITPSSGIVQKALLDLDRGYTQLNTKNNAQFATNAINVQKNQQQQAAQVGTALTTLEQQTNAQDEARALQAVNLLFQVPQLADNRLALAQGVVGANSINPAQLLGQQANFQQVGNQQDLQTQLMWASVLELIPSLIDAF